MSTKYYVFTPLLGKTVISHKVEIIFGNPQKDCSGTGICKMEVLTPFFKTQPCPCANKVRGRLIFDQISNILLVCVNNDELTENLKRRHFNSFQFVVEETWYASPEMARCFRLEELKVPSGNYPITFQRDQLTIVIAL